MSQTLGLNIKNQQGTLADDLGRRTSKSLQYSVSKTLFNFRVSWIHPVNKNDTLLGVKYTDTKLTERIDQSTEPHSQAPAVTLIACLYCHLWNQSHANAAQVIVVKGLRIVPLPLMSTGYPQKTQPGCFFCLCDGFRPSVCGAKMCAAFVALWHCANLDS